VNFDFNSVVHHVIILSCKQCVAAFKPYRAMNSVINLMILNAKATKLN